MNTIIHLASIANDPASNLDPKLTWEISCQGTMHLCELAKKNKKVIFCGRTGLFRYIDMVPAVQIHLQIVNAFIKNFR